MFVVSDKDRLQDDIMMMIISNFRTSGLCIKGFLLDKQATTAFDRYSQR